MCHSKKEKKICFHFLTIQSWFTLNNIVILVCVQRALQMFQRITFFYDKNLQDSILFQPSSEFVYFKINHGDHNVFKSKNSSSWKLKSRLIDSVNKFSLFSLMNSLAESLLERVCPTKMISSFQNDNLIKRMWLVEKIFNLKFNSSELMASY